MRYKLTRENYVHTLKVFGYSAVSAVIGVAITMMGNLDVPSQYLFLVSIVNTLLVALKEFLNDKR